MNDESAVEELPREAEVEDVGSPAEAPASGPRPHFEETPTPTPEPALGLLETPAIAMPEGGPGRQLSGPLAMVGVDERREEARRFARLLISEIKLYNERAVLEGREQANLYERLRDDIDRSRQMYDERIPQDVRSSSNFFYEELVVILADGRPEVLGL
jgi:hypothetical protein